MSYFINLDFTCIKLNFPCSLKLKWRGTIVLTYAIVKEMLTPTTTTDNISTSLSTRLKNPSWILKEKLILPVLSLHGVKWEPCQLPGMEDVETVHPGTALFRLSTARITLIGIPVSENTSTGYQTGCRKYWRNRQLRAIDIEECLPSKRLRERNCDK